MKVYVIIALILTMSACSTSKNVSPSIGDPKQISESEAPLASRIYFLQHKLIRQWVYESNDAFFFELMNRNNRQIIEAAEEVVNVEYADGIIINPIPESNAVLFEFPRPTSLAHCYYVLIVKKNGDYSYYTYEKTMNFGDDSVFGVVGGWGREGGHSNYGARGYKTSEEFIKDVLEI